MATLGLKEMGKFLWEGREKVLPSWLSQFSFAKQMEQILNLQVPPAEGLELVTVLSFEAS